MVQLYNPNVVGKQVLINVKTINSDKLKFVDDIKPFMNDVVKELDLNVVGQCSQQFEPHGATMVYLLSESHLSIHTFVDEGKVAIDLFSCDISVDFGKIKKIICYHFEVNSLNIDMTYFTRGS